MKKYIMTALCTLGSLNGMMEKQITKLEPEHKTGYIISPADIDCLMEKIEKIRRKYHAQQSSTHVKTSTEEKEEEKEDSLPPILNLRLLIGLSNTSTF
jgi:hypothetical protein